MRTLSITTIIQSILFASLLSLFFACSSYEYWPKNDVLIAVQNGNVVEIKRHIANGIDLNAQFVAEDHPYLKDIAGAAALHIAVVTSNEENLATFKTVVGLLLDGGADIDIKARNNEEATPLGWAAYFGKVGMVELLVARGANVNAADKNGYTPLDAAIGSPFVDGKIKTIILDFLKGKGATFRDD